MQEVLGRYTSAKVMTDTYEEETYKQVLGVCNQEVFKNSDIVIMPDCLPEYTEVLTERGFVFFNDLSPENKIAMFNKDTKKVELDFPKKIISRELLPGEKIVRFETPSGVFCTTKKHRTPYKKNMGECADFFLNNSLLMKDVEWSGHGVALNKGIPLSDLEISLVAWVVGDGNIHKTDNTTSVTKRIRFGFKKKRKIERVTFLLDSMGLVYSKTEDPVRGTILEINTEDSSKYLDIVGDNKSFPFEWVWSMSDAQAQVLIKEIIKIDGDYQAYTKNRGYRLNTSRKLEADFFSALLVTQGKLCSAKHRNTEGFNKKERTLYYVNAISEDTLMHSKSGYHNKKIQVSEMEYSGRVFCLECKTTFFIVRQNGLCFVTGNCHAGAGSVVGFTMPLTNFVIPNIIGVDIGCGIDGYNLGNLDISGPGFFKEFDDFIREKIPYGFGTYSSNKIAKTAELFDKVSDVAERLDLKNVDRIFSSIGTLGGGNHFIELGKSDNGCVYLFIHSGSRNFGLQIANFYQGKAKQYVTQNNIGGVQKGLEYLPLDSDEGKNYLKDMSIAQEYAVANRDKMAKTLLQFLKPPCIDVIKTTHNYINFEDGVVRKGAIQAQLDQKVVIPLNMRDGVIIGKGKGNKSWNFSAPHGAGRILARGAAKRQLDLAEFENTMKGIWSSCISKETIDESPMAYKPMEEILNYVGETISVLDIVKPVYNFKATE